MQFEEQKLTATGYNHTYPWAVLAGCGGELKSLETSRYHRNCQAPYCLRDTAYCLRKTMAELLRKWPCRGRKAVSDLKWPGYENL